MGVIGAGRWSRRAHVPAWLRDPRCRVVGVHDRDVEGARTLAAEAGSTAVGSAEELILDPAVDVVDVVTWNPSHFEYAIAAIEAGKHVLCEKPVHHDFHEVLRADRAAKARGLRTKVGLTFRFSPAMIHMRRLIGEGYVGRPLVFNGFEQNSQFLDPLTPMRFGESDTLSNGQLRAASLEGYGAPIIDLAMWFADSPITEVVGLLTNQVPARRGRDSAEPRPLPIDDADAFVGHFGNGAMVTIQSSYVTVGNYPGLEARLYGSEGALICRLVEEEGVCERIWGATKDQVEFRPLEVPQELYPPGGSLREPWETSFYSNLVRSFVDEISDPALGAGGDFATSAAVQEVIDAVEISHQQRRWVQLPLAADAAASEPRGEVVEP